MSGLDEQESYWILEYKELMVNFDYAYMYRGFLARSFEEAKNYGKFIIEYLMYAYGGDEDLDEFEYVRVFRIDQLMNPFIYNKDELERMKNSIDVSD